MLLWDPTLPSSPLWQAGFEDQDFSYWRDEQTFGPSLLVEVWAELSAGASLSSPAQEGRHARHEASLLLLAPPTSGSAFFAGLLSKEWPKRRNRAPRISHSLSPPPHRPYSWDGQTHAGFTNWRLGHWCQTHGLDVSSAFCLSSDQRGLNPSWPNRQTQQQKDWHMDRKQWALQRVRSSRTSPWLQD